MIVILTYVALIVFGAGFLYRGLSIAMMPVHLRWELAPVPHEKGRAHYGGSYLEEFEWWTKPREKSLVGEAFYMFQEIVFLKGVWEHNRSLWVFSFPFHFGLYLLVGMGGCLILASFGVPFFGPAALALGGAGYVLGSVGTLGLLARRAFDPKLKPFTSMASYFNLLFLAAVFVTGCVALFSGGFLADMTSYLKAVAFAEAGPALGAAISTHIAVGMLFLVYLPFTYMMHFVAKYFTYHEVRWNGEPMSGNDAMQEEVKKLLGQTVTWSAPHIGADGKKNWVDIATAGTAKEKKDA
ncbi:MAG: respiratory nitrate reductase subunit gamma [Elusimicrobiota bacterium]